MTTPDREPGQISLRDLVVMSDHELLCSACGSVLRVLVHPDQHALRLDPKPFTPAPTVWEGRKLLPSMAADLEAMLRVGMDHLGREHNYPETPAARADRIMRDVTNPDR